MDNNKIKTVLLTGSTGVIGSSVKDYLKSFCPEIRVICLFTPFSLQNLHDNLKNSTIDYFINAAGAPANESSKINPYCAFDINAFGVLKQLEIIRKYSPNTRYINFGSIYEQLNSPYASSKRVSRDIIKAYRENYGLYCIQATLGFTEYYNRSEKFITRKISKCVAKIYHELKDTAKTPLMLELENVEDIFNFTWGEDVARGIWYMLNQDMPKEFTIINPNSCDLYSFAAEAFKIANLTPESNIIRTISNRTGQSKIEINNMKDWAPIYSFKAVAQEMVKFDIKNYE